MQQKLGYSIFSLVAMLLWSTPAWATYTVGNHTAASSSAGNDVTTMAIDTSGNKAIVVGIAAQTCSAGPHDNKNSDGIWTLVKTFSTGPLIEIWLATGPTLVVGTGHTFTSQCGNPTYPSILVLGLNSTMALDSSIIDQWAASTSSGTTIQAGSTTPGFDNEIVISFGTAASAVGATFSSIDSGLTIVENVAEATNAYGGALAYRIQTTAAASNPTWTYSPSGVARAINVTLADHQLCTGSSPSLTAATWSAVQTCHTLAADGDTITVTPGSYTVTAETVITKYVKIVMGGTVNLTDNVCTGACTGTYLVSITESTVGNTRLQGPLNITKGSGYHSAPAAVIGMEYATGGKPILVTDVHYTLSGSGDFIGPHTNRGVIWNNSAQGDVSLGGASCGNNASFVRHKWTGGGISNWESPLTYGSADKNGDQALYIENNTLNTVLEGIDVDDDGRTVIRYNMITNSGTETHGVDTSGIMGGRFIDYDHNTFIRDATPQPGTCAAPVNMMSFIGLRGGTAFIHDNVIPDINDIYWGDKAELVFLVEELRRNNGAYPCWTGGYPAPHQVGWGYTVGGTSYPLAGGGTGHQDLEPVYIWNNTGAGNYAAPAVQDYAPNECAVGAPSSATFIVSGRDFYTATAKPGYTPYTYPHPLRMDVSPTPARSQGIILF